jgi:histone H3/H4
MKVVYKNFIKEIKPTEMRLGKNVSRIIDKQIETQLRIVFEFAKTRTLAHQRKTINSKDVELAFQEYFESHNVDYLDMMQEQINKFIKETKKEVETNASRRICFENNE